MFKDHKISLSRSLSLSLSLSLSGISPANFDIFHILVLQEYCVLTESRILLKPMLGGVRIVALSSSSHEQTQNTSLLGFFYIVGSLYF